MAAESGVPYILQELISPNTPPSPSNPAPPNSPENFDFPLLSHEWFPRYKLVHKFGKECSIHLEATLSPNSEDPSISVHFSLKDRTKLLQISSARHLSSFFDCPLIDKPFDRGYTIKASQFCPLKIKTDDYPVKREHVNFFEMQIDQLLKELLESAKGDIHIEAEASVDRVVLPDEAVDVVKEMEGKGFREDSCGDSKRYDCAVCLGDVRLRWFQGMRLSCGHVFHVKCISRWFDNKTSCPMCRREMLL